jgi:hypothetical protein
MRLQSFADFQGSGWKLASFFQWSSNVVTALVNGARLLSQAGSLSLFSNRSQACLPGKLGGVSEAS